MTKKSFRSRPNKSEQIARFLLKRGTFMTARQIYDAGFRFEDGEETSPNLISVLLNKLHHSARYVVDRSYMGEGGNRVTLVKVISIADTRYGNRGAPADITGTELNIWRQLLTRKTGERLALKGAA